MKVSIIGVGAIGGTIAKQLIKAGHQVSVANSGGKEAVTPFAQEIGATAHGVETVMQRCRCGDSFCTARHQPLSSFQNICSKHFQKKLL